MPEKFYQINLILNQNTKKNDFFSFHVSLFLISFHFFVISGKKSSDRCCDRLCQCVSSNGKKSDEGIKYRRRHLWVNISFSFFFEMEKYLMVFILTQLYKVVTIFLKMYVKISCQSIVRLFNQIDRKWTAVLNVHKHMYDHIYRQNKWIVRESQKISEKKTIYRL